MPCARLGCLNSKRMRFMNLSTNERICYFSVESKMHVLTAKRIKIEEEKVTDIDRLKGIFTDYRHAGDLLSDIS